MLVAKLRILPCKKHRFTQLRSINNVLETSVKVLELGARSLVVDVQMMTKSDQKRDVRSRYHSLCEVDPNSIIVGSRTKVGLKLAIKKSTCRERWSNDNHIGIEH